MFIAHVNVHAQGKTEQEAKEVGGKIFTFGSYRLEVHGKGKRKVVSPTYY